MLVDMKYLEIVKFAYKINLTFLSLISKNISSNPSHIAHERHSLLKTR